ncbi:hypothetical protein CCR85_02510 [Rhodothalassium salexigens]|uniref:hypothetical protein n=1 Tax=Rhodothalassium salexigens TaxID=1086 RepID=UPI001912C064|nr:hypothetical protein [Rhodothalassium salexigens]MBK5910362.1 hypothetical protein [Rhodothalassium salexigens]MBK5921025.1 hypothetical protein [Rhodothalassium salexigens]
MSKPTIRTVHHFAATGGTMICKSLAVLPEVYLLSEVSPFTFGQVRFNPVDPLQQAVCQYQARLGFSANELAQAFYSRLRPVYDKVAQQGGHLVLRDHSHSDWFGPQPRTVSTLAEVLKGAFDLTSIVTLRNPVETYVSAHKRGWTATVASFDDYCARILSLVDYFDGRPVFHYEYFVADPDASLRAMADALALPFDPGWRARYNSVRLTGDSGRGSGEADIRPLPLKPVSAELRRAVLASDTYRQLCERFGYLRDPEDMAAARREAIAARG